MNDRPPVRVVWLCNFSNPEVRKKLSFSGGKIDSILRKFSKSDVNIHLSDYGKWITNGIKEIESHDNIELHVISPHYRLKETIQGFSIDNINYHFYADESFSFIWKIISRFGLNKRPKYKRNNRILTQIVTSINPDIIHLIGAENINYSSYVLNNQFDIPLIVQLQTLVNDPKVFSSLSRNRSYIRECESKILKKANYIFTSVPLYRRIIKDTICPGAVFLSNTLAVGVTIDRQLSSKEYDFVYFSANINKSADLAIEAFAKAKQSFPNITLDIIGYYSQEYKQQLDELIARHSLSGSVFFEGKLPSYEDVMRQVKKAKAAIIPLRPDALPSTVREALSLGCPVVTTITPSTPSLNERRLSVLLSEPGDPDSHAKNMCRIFGEPGLYEKLRDNGYITVCEMYDNCAIIRKVVASYIACLEHYYYNTPIPNSLL